MIDFCCVKLALRVVRGHIFRLTVWFTTVSKKRQYAREVSKGMRLLSKATWTDSTYASSWLDVENPSWRWESFFPNSVYGCMRKISHNMVHWGTMKCCLCLPLTKCFVFGQGSAKKPYALRYSLRTYCLYCQWLLGPHVLCFPQGGGRLLEMSMRDQISDMVLDLTPILKHLFY